MTTEIAVINRLGVALAADSAVTIPGYGGDKVFNTGDKLFELSEHCPVALMINGSMDFLGVPWEVIAKDFRRHPPANSKTLSIRHWMERFLEFVAGHSTVKKKDFRRWLDDLIREELYDLRQQVRDRLNELAAQDGSENVQDAVRRLFLETAEARVTALTREGSIDSLKDLSEVQVLETMRPALKALQLQELNFEPSADLHEQLAKLITIKLLMQISRVTATGLIICGFGGCDLFPSLYAVEIDGYICDRLRYSKSHDVELTRGKEIGNAISFAQTDVVDRLLRGIDSRFIDSARAFISENVAEGLKENFARLKLRILREDDTAIDPADLGGMLGRVIASQFESNFTRQLTDEFERKFKETIALMPKQDLIELAEALVSITAIERKASDDAGTVGGPIDVALITRAEGFVWIKRKHHFNAELNPRYMARAYQPYKEEEIDDGKTGNA